MDSNEVLDNTGVEVPAAGEQFEAPASEQAAQETVNQEPQEQYVPLKAFEAIRNEMQEIKNANAYLHSQMAGLASVQQPRPQQSVNPLDNYQDDDIVTAGDLKKVANMAQQQQQQQFQQLNAQYENMLRAQAVRAKFSDYDEVVKDLPRLAQENPGLAEMVISNRNPQEAAYWITKGIKAETPQETHAAQKNLDRIISNSAKPRSASSAGGSAGMSAVDKYANMSQDDFLKEMERVKSQPD